MALRIDISTAVVSSESARVQAEARRDPVPPPPPLSVPVGPDSSTRRIIDGGGSDPAGLSGLSSPGTGRVVRQSGTVLSSEQLAAIRPFRGPDNEIDYDPQLQAVLGQVLAELGVSGANGMVANKNLALALVDISDPRSPRFAGVNADMEMYAASMPKLAVIAAVLERVSKGELSLDGSVRSQLGSHAEGYAQALVVSGSERRKLRAMLSQFGLSEPRQWNSTNVGALLDQMTLRQMLQVTMAKSSNAAPGALQRYLGKAGLRSFLERSGLTDGDAGFWLGRFYWQDSAPQYHGGGSQNASPLQVARLYYLIATDQLFSPELSREMRDIGSALAPDRHAHLGHKFMIGLSRVDPPPTSIVRKSGTAAGHHADSVLVTARGADGRMHQYILVMQARNAGATGLAERLLPPLHRAIVGGAVS